MHELSLAHALIKSVIREMTERRIARVTTICVRIGPLSGIMTEALAFGFESLRSDTPLAATQLRIEESPAAAVCQRCAHTFPLDEPVFSCPECGSEDLRISGGDDLHIAYLEVENVCV